VGWLRVRDALKAWQKARREFEKAYLILNEAIGGHARGEVGEKDVEAALIAVIEAGDRMERARQRIGKMVSGAHVEGLETIALTLCTLSLIAMFLTGYVGYFVVDRFWPSFYYSPIKEGKNVWLFMQLACMVVYAAGVFLAFNGIRRTSHAMA
jgi:hypothetical protein